MLFRSKTATAGTVNFFVAGTLQTHFKTQSLEGQPLLENVEYTFSNPLKHRANAGLSWNLRQWTLGWNARYYDSYRVYGATATAAAAATAILTQGNDGVVPSQTYHDIFATYRFDRSGAAGWKTFTDDLELTVGIRNVFNQEPPFDSSNTNRYFSTFGDPRLASYYLTVRKTF